MIYNMNKLSVIQKITISSTIVKDFFSVTNKLKDFKYKKIIWVEKLEKIFEEGLE
jgi:hypothetical protein